MLFVPSNRPYARIAPTMGARIETTPRDCRSDARPIAPSHGMVGEDELRATLAQFDDLWAALTPKEQVRVIHLLVERIVYDGAAGTVAITFRPSGIRTLECQVGEAA